MVSQAGDEHTRNRSNREHLRHKVDLTATLGLVSFPEDNFVLREAWVRSGAHERNVKLLSLVEQLGRLHSAFYFGLADLLEGFYLIYAETLSSSDNTVITSRIERDCRDL